MNQSNVLMYGVVFLLVLTLIINTSSSKFSSAAHNMLLNQNKPNFGLVPKQPVTFGNNELPSNSVSSFEPTMQKNDFSPTLETESSQLNNFQPKQFSKDFVPPPIKEEIGLAMVYPQGMGVSMSPADSNSFSPGNKDSLLTDYSIPESYGESSFNDPTGKLSARIIDISSTGTQDSFKPMDSLAKHPYSAAYTLGNKEFVLPNSVYTDYNDTFVPERNTVLQGSPGKDNTMAPCDTLYPPVVKYGDSCITAGDIPYGEYVMVNGQKVVNPRLVSREEFYTGNYDADKALSNEFGLLYPNKVN